MKADLEPAVLALQRAVVGLVTDVRINTNRKTLLSLRGSPWSGLRVSVHRRLLDQPEALTEIPAWIRSRGRRPSATLHAAIDRVFTELASQRRATLPTMPVFEPVSGAVDLQTFYQDICQRSFPGMPVPPCSWGNAVGARSLTTRRRIRFGAYARCPSPRIIINRLLDQPWVAREFIAFILHHELCHHAQALAPIPGEKPHSRRFKTWESAFPRFREVLLWERVHLDRFLTNALPAVP